MNLIPWRNKSREGNGGGLAPLAELRQEMDRLFDNFTRDPWGSLTSGFEPAARWFPALDVAETDQEVTIHAEVPGVDPNDLDISVTGRRLTLSGEKKETSERKEKDYFHTETRYGNFTRSIELPSDVDTENVNAEHSNGVLTITLKKTAAATKKKIQVKTT
jgi:HSP20 family protein